MLTFTGELVSYDESVKKKVSNIEDFEEFHLWKMSKDNVQHHKNVLGLCMNLAKHNKVKKITERAIAMTVVGV